MADLNAQDVAQWATRRSAGPQAGAVSTGDPADSAQAGQTPKAPGEEHMGKHPQQVVNDIAVKIDQTLTELTAAINGPDFPPEERSAITSHVQDMRETLQDMRDAMAGGGDDPDEDEDTDPDDDDDTDVDADDEDHPGDDTDED